MGPSGSGACHSCIKCICKLCTTDDHISSVSRPQPWKLSSFCTFATQQSFSCFQLLHTLYELELDLTHQYAGLACKQQPADPRIAACTGKTTLLDLLAGRKTVGQLKGAILFAGKKPRPAFLKRYTG